MTRSHARRVSRRLNDATRRTSVCALGLEGLEARRLFCAYHAATNLTPTVVNTGPAGHVTQINEPADIVWTNRGTGASDTDRFNSTFGTMADTARAVIDAVIVQYERMIGSFNYAVAGQKFNLSLSMSSTGFNFGGGASGLQVNAQGIPIGGTISLLRGNNDGISNNDNGWFIDPTPFDSSEFLGGIQNAFSMDATGGGPASGKGDFFTVAAAEITHCMGQNNTGLWNAKTTNTGVNDTVASPGKLWLFNGPSIQHLMTSDNGGSQDFGSAIHTGEPPSTFTSGPTVYTATNDQGNAFFEFSRRYNVDNVHALMFKDAFNYLSVNPSQYGTAFSVLNETTHALTIRGGDFAAGASASNDIISITRSGSTLTVSVDTGYDVPGSGAFAGVGNLPAWVSTYDISQVTSINIQSSNGDDTISIPSNLGAPVSVDAGPGTDTVTFTGTSSADAFTLTGTGATSASTTLTLTSGVETLILDGQASADTFNVPTAGGANLLTLNGGDGDDVFTLTAASGLPVNVNGGNNDDTVAIAMGFGGSVTFDGGSGSDALNFDASDANEIIFVSATSASGGGNSASFSGLESLTVNGRNGNDTFSVDGTGFSSMAVVLNGGVGNDNTTLNNLSAGSSLTYNAGTGTDTVTVASSSTWNVNNDLGDSAQIVNVTTPGTTRFNVSQHLNTLNVSSSGRASLAANGSRLLSAKSLVVAANAQFDLFDNDMVVATTSASARATIEGYVKKGYNFGGNDGVGGIISSAAANNPNGNTALGFMSGDDYNNNNGGQFDGQAVSTNDSVIKYTYFGDVDFNGAVDASDYNLIDFGFSNHLTGWANGDADYSGGVDASDYNLIDFAFATQIGIL